MNRPAVFNGCCDGYNEPGSCRQDTSGFCNCQFHLIDVLKAHEGYGAVGHAIW